MGTYTLKEDALIYWTKQGPGDIGRVRAEQLQDDPTAVLMHDGYPDWVKLPEKTPRYGGETRRVAEHRRGRCACEVAHEVPMMVLDGPGKLVVFACDRIGMAVASYEGAL